MTPVNPSDAAAHVEPVVAPAAASGSPRPDASHHRDEPSVVETIQSLVIAFALAMMFRGFVLEGFVIPTGSMAPTLLGEHTLRTSPLTGYAVIVDTSRRSLLEKPSGMPHELVDPMIGPEAIFARPTTEELLHASRPGDRILVLKYLYGLFSPSRWDIVVFKNPTAPEENYIKRLVGLPNETVLLADGDVFVREEDDHFRIRRKPDHVQRAVWQPIFDSDYRPADMELFGRLWPAWEGTGWSFDEDYVIRHTGDGGGTGGVPATLAWSQRRRLLNDWNGYNLPEIAPDAAYEECFSISDLRVRAAVRPASDDGRITLRLLARGHVFEFELHGSSAEARLRPIAARESGSFTARASGRIRPLRAGEIRRVECWHVDQMLRLFVDGSLVVELPYDWSAEERLLFATGERDGWYADQAELEWRFSDAGVELRHLRVDRDLFYRPDWLSSRGDPAFGTHPSHPAVMGPDHFFLCGDNSGASLDGRKLREPHPLVRAQIDPTRFVVHRRLLVGKAFHVYFPSPHGLVEGGTRFIPDFGRLRFIR